MICIALVYVFLYCQIKYRNPLNIDDITEEAPMLLTDEQEAAVRQIQKAVSYTHLDVYKRQALVYVFLYCQIKYSNPLVIYEDCYRII